MPLVYGLGASLIISFVSIVGLYWMYSKITTKKVEILVSLAAGSLLGGAFLHLLPEAGQEIELEIMFSLVLLSFVVFFGLETWFHWRHCHKTNCKHHSFAYVNLLGDSVHNLIDGIIIGGAFCHSIQLGVSTSLAVLMHEIPQEIGDMGILLYAGMEKNKAFKLNLAISFVALIGVVIGVKIAQSEVWEKYLLAMAGGGFLYIGSSDLIPEIRKKKKCWLCLAMVLAGIGLMSFI